MMHDPPRSYRRFVERFEELGAAWEAIRREESRGPLSERERRLVKLGIAIGARKEGAVHSATRKAVAAGLEPAAIEQVIALAASTVGLPQSVAAHTWILDVLEPEDPGSGG